MPYGHLIAAAVMTLGVYQVHSSIVSFSMLTSASRGPSAIAVIFLMVDFLDLSEPNIRSSPKFQDW